MSILRLVEIPVGLVFALIFVLQGNAAAQNASQDAASALPQSSLGVSTESQRLMEKAKALGAMAKSMPVGKARSLLVNDQAQALCESIKLGNLTALELLRSVIPSLRKDESLDVASRFALVSTFEHLDLAAKTALSDANQRRSQMAVLYRQLIAEFPSVPDAYLGLLHLGQTEPDTAKAKRIMEELQASLAAPSWMRSMARTNSNRFDLVGRRLWDILPATESVVPHKVALPTGLPSEPASKEEWTRTEVPRALLYSWSMQDPISIKGAQDLKRFEAKGFKLIGINLDTDLPAARDFSKRLPGEHFFDPLGIGGQPAQRLLLTPGFHVYVTDKRGVVSSVTAALNLDEQLSGKE